MTKHAFFGGEFVPIEKAKVSIMTHTFNYGTGCFEGIRAYWNEEEEQLFVFKMREHYERFHRSCRILLIELPYSVEQLGEITVEILEATLSPSNKMRVMYRANLNFERFKRYFYDLLRKGFIEKEEASKGQLVYKTTERGRTLLVVLKKAQELLSSDEHARIL